MVINIFDEKMEGRPSIFFARKFSSKNQLFRDVLVGLNAMLYVF